MLRLCVPTPSFPFGRLPLLPVVRPLGVGFVEGMSHVLPLLPNVTVLSKYGGTTRGDGKRGSRGPGVVCVFTSSLNVNSLDYCKTAGIDAPGVSHLTKRNIRFAGTCTASTADAPSHFKLLANVCP